MDKLNLTRGFSLIEILIAMAIALIVISGVVAGSGGMSDAIRGYQSTIVSGQTDAEGLAVAQQVIEQTQALGRVDFNLVNNSTATTSSGSLTYTKTVTAVLQSDLLTKLVTVVVSWLGNGGQTFSTKLSTLVTDLENVNAPNTCNSVLSGDWSNPQVLNPNHAIDIANPSTLTSVAVNANVAYITGQHSGTPQDDFYTVNVASSTFPTSIAAIDTGNGLNAVAIASSSSAIYAFTATNSTAGQLQVIRVTDPSALMLATTTRVLGSGGVGNAIFYRDHMLYLGLTANGTDPVFIVYDVSSPTVPVRKGSLALNGHGVNAIYVKGNYAYIATPDDENMITVDIKLSSPTFMQNVGGYTPPNLPESEGVGSDHGKSIYLVGNTAYLGRTYGAKEFYILNVTNPESIASVVASQNTGSGNGTTVNGLMVRSDLAFMTTNSAFQVWSLSNLSNIIKIGSIDIASVGGSPPGSLACNNNLFYVGVIGPSGVSGHDILRIIGPGVPKINPTIATEIHDASHNIVTTVSAGTAVHDKATLSGTAGTPTGTVDFTYYTDGACSAGAVSAGTVALIGGVAHPSTTKTPVTANTYSFKAHYNGDGTYNALDGDCEPLTVTGAFGYSLSASPTSKTLSQGSSYTETITVTKTSGSAQSVTVSLSGFQNNVSYTPLTAMCTPNPTCSLPFTITAAANGQKVTRTITATGSTPATTTTFSLTIQ